MMTASKRSNAFPAFSKSEWIVDNIAGDNIEKRQGDHYRYDYCPQYFFQVGKNKFGHRLLLFPGRLKKGPLPPELSPIRALPGA
jgi:hypothetical protein